MNHKGTVLFVLGLLALSLAAVEHAAAKGGAAAEPIACDYVDLGDATRVSRTREGVEKYFSAEGAKGMRFVTFSAYARTDVPPVIPSTATTPGFPAVGNLAVFCSR